jgi:hypothetical protein
LQKILHGVNVTKKQEKDNLDMERYAIAVKHLIKYVKTPNKETNGIDREEILQKIVEESG